MDPKQVNSSSAPRTRINDTGISVLHDPEDAIADIVFVHGLQGHPRNTWACDRTTQLAPQGGGANTNPHRLKKIFSRKHRTRSEDAHKREAETIFWPLDLLPEDCVDSRILTWGYDSKVSNFFGGAASQSNLGAHAQNLLRALMFERLHSRGRRIIFIAHSFGGIIVKDVLSQAASSDKDTLLLDIYTSTEAILFLGTPHRGSSHAETAETIRRIVSASGFDAQNQNLMALQINSAELERVHASFMKLYQQQDRHSFKLVTFQEAKSIAGINRFNLNQRIVEPFSSSITGTEPTQTINANHMSMCRFQSKVDEGYRQVVGEVLIIISEIQRKIVQKRSPSQTTVSTAYSLNDVERKCVALLTQNISSAAEYRSSLPSRVEGTCQWILSNSHYRDWNIQSEACLLWIIGYPGSGKTILSTYLLEYLDQGSLSPRMGRMGTTLCYFFCNENIDTQRDGTAILRSLIHQLLERRRPLVKHVKSAYDIQGPQLDRNFNALWKIFIAIAADRRIGSISVIIDAIDECEEITRERFLNNVIELISKQQSAGSRIPRIKFLVTSRPLLSPRYTSNLLKIDPSLNHVEKDLRLVIRSKVEAIDQRIGCGPDIRAYIVDILHSRADKTFLWVTLVLRLLEDELRASTTKFKLIIDELPQTLANTYERFLSGIATKHRPDASRLLHLVVGSLRPLTLDEMRILFAIQDNHHTLTSVKEEAPFSMQKSIESVLGPLVRIWDSRIYLVHQSLKDFLQGLSSRPAHPLSAAFGIDPREASLVLAKACVTYLLLDDFKQDLFSRDRSSSEGSPVSPVESSTEVEFVEHFWDSMDLQDDTMFNDPAEFEAETCAAIAKQYNLFDYATRHWSEHFLSASSKSEPALQKPVLVLSDTTTSHGLNWFRFYWYYSEINLSRPRNFGPMLTASYFGHLTTLKSLLQEGIVIEPDVGIHSIYWASRKGHHTIVDLFLGQKINADVEVLEGQTCLSAAVQFNHLAVVSCLLGDKGFIGDNRGYRVNHAPRGGRTPLSLAAGNGYVEIVRRLLQHPQVQPDIEDNDKWSPLFWSLSGKHLDVLQLLISDGRIAVNHLDKSGRTVLSWAASEGQLEMVKYLMSLNHLNAQQPDHKGRTALSWAAGCGHLQTTIFLRRSRRIDVSTRDNDGRNALSWACSGSHSTVVEYLVKYNPHGIDEPDIDGWTPLAWALFNNCPQIVQLLVDSGRVDVNKTDKSGKTALAWAASYGYPDVVRILLNAKGIDVDGQAMSYATRYPDIVKLLKEYSY